MTKLTHPTEVEAILTYVLEHVLTDESKWTQGALARDAQGNDLLDEDNVLKLKPGAVCFCLEGAIMHASETLYQKPAPFQEITPLLRQAVNDGYSRWNDVPERTFEEIRTALEKARDIAKEQPTQ